MLMAMVKFGDDRNRDNMRQRQFNNYVDDEEDGDEHDEHVEHEEEEGDEEETVTTTTTTTIVMSMLHLQWQQIGLISNCIPGREQ